MKWELVDQRHYWRRFAIASATYVALMAFWAAFVLGWGKPSRDILVGGYVGYAIVGLVVAATLRTRAIYSFCAVLIVSCLMMRGAAFLPTLAALEPSVVLRFFGEQVLFSGVSSFAAFCVASRFVPTVAASSKSS